MTCPNAPQPCHPTSRFMLFGGLGPILHMIHLSSSLRSDREARANTNFGSWSSEWRVRALFV